MGAIIIFAILLFAVGLAATRPRAAVLTCVFLAPWYGLVADFGVQVYAYQLFLLALLGVTIVRSLQPGWQPRSVALSVWLGTFLLYGICWSIIKMGFLPDADVAGGALRNSTTRSIIQIGMLLFSVSPVALLSWLALRGDDLAACGRIYVVSGVVLAVIGWIQLAIWYATGSNPIQISAISTLLGGAEQYNRAGAFGFAQLAIYRMNSLAGEPRQLGTALVLAMLVIQAYALTAVRPRTLRLLGVWLFLLVSAAATYSTSAVALWIVGSLVQLPAAWLLRVPVRRSVGSMGGAALLVFIGVGLAVAAGEARGIPIIDLLAERTIERIDSDGAVEDFDLAILSYLTEHPADAITGLGIGDAHLYAAPYLEPLFLIYAEGTVFAAKTGYLRLISEVGFIGFALFLAWYGRLNFAVAHAVRRDPGLAALIPMSATFLTVYLANSAIGNEFWMVAGILTAAAAARVPARAGRTPVPAGAPA
ncbi:hypothetical protein [Glacieibacterium frigidum]|uniref:O-antigen polymerase n=1 Tax=Glacieibacterium frigidum TaxID=2593303 RepID=A0A552U9G6_9SPHN|nr:hypothetical protein [Glacieibacterium frigidum]TRW14861.1 hypothetical protein FMM06_14400 [Glacieibacterium frigidum]